MKIKIMTNDALKYVKENIANLYSFYTIDSDPEVWIKEKIGKKAFIEVSDLDFEDVDLLLDELHPSSTDIANIKIINRVFGNINESFATDERLWAGLAHTLFYKYMIKRWPAIGSNNYKDVLNHYFYTTQKPRCYMINTLAKMWWIGHKTCFNIDDKYKILDFIGHDLNGYLFTLFGSNWSNSEKSLKLFFDAVFKYEEETGNKVGRGLFNDAMQYANSICGLYIIDACDDYFFLEKVLNYLYIRYDEIQKEQEYNKLNNVKLTGINKLDLVIKAINKIGGHGTTAKILKAYEELNEKELSSAIKNYVIDSLEQNCPDSPSFRGKKIFYKISLDGSNIWKVSNEYLVVSNYQNRNELVGKQINNLDDNVKIIFNIISSLKGNDRFNVGILLNYKQQVVNMFPEIENYEKLVKSAIKELSRKGLIELQENDIFKKTYLKLKN